MSVADGFSLWIGKTLADLFIVAAIFAVLAVGCIAAVLIEWVVLKLKGRR